jgi:hypothetical protein
MPRKGRAWKRVELKKWQAGKGHMAMTSEAREVAGQ